MNFKNIKIKNIPNKNQQKVKLIVYRYKKLMTFLVYGPSRKGTAMNGPLSKVIFTTVSMLYIREKRLIFLKPVFN